MQALRCFGKESLFVNLAIVPRSVCKQPTFLGLERSMEDGVDVLVSNAGDLRGLPLLQLVDVEGTYLEQDVTFVESLVLAIYANEMFQ